MINLFCPDQKSPQMAALFQALKESEQDLCIYSTYQNTMKGQKIIFCFDLDAFGDSPALENTIKEALIRDSEAFKGVIAGLIIISETEFFTKRYAQRFILNMTLREVSFVGHPLVEVVEGYKNLRTWQKQMLKPLDVIAVHLALQLINRLEREGDRRYKKPNILVLHASQDSTSNTLMLWNAVEKHLEDLSPHVLHVENGTIVDCKGCGFTQCIHYSESNSCFYGGQVVLEILPAIEAADIIVWLLPNYNDAISAMLTAVINRMTVLYRRVPLFEKSILAIVVSGNSGGDCVASQLIGALNINKGMYLPNDFLLAAIANDPGTVMDIPGIEIMAEGFAQRLRKLTL